MTPLLFVALVSSIILFVVQTKGKANVSPEKSEPSRLPNVNGDEQAFAAAPVIELNNRFSPWKAPAKVKTEKPVVVLSSPEKPLPRLIHDFDSAPPVSNDQRLAASKKGVEDARKLAFGSLIQCRLIQPVMCGSSPVPLVGEIMRAIPDVKGRPWIPLGSQIHGTAKFVEGSDRAEGDGTWTLVLPGRILVDLKGGLLDKSLDQSNGRYGSTDATAGLVGTVTRHEKANKTQEFARQALAIGAEASQDRMRTALGEIELGSARSAVLRGASSLFGGATPKLQEEAKPAIYIPAGKEFYIYVNDRASMGTASGAPDVNVMLQERAKILQQLQSMKGGAR